MIYRVCKSFEIESGHMLSKHPGRCRFPHGHSRKVEIVVSSTTLNEFDMVCDFKALKLAVAACVDRLDHAMVVNSSDASAKNLIASRERVVVFEGEDPTTEVLARRIYEEVRQAVGKEFVAGDGVRYRLPEGLRVERVRVSETSSSWAEYGCG